MFSFSFWTSITVTILLSKLFSPFTCSNKWSSTVNIPEVWHKLCETTCIHTAGSLEHTDYPFAGSYSKLPLFSLLNHRSNIFSPCLNPVARWFRELSDQFPDHPWIALFLCVFATFSHHIPPLPVLRQSSRKLNVRVHDRLAPDNIATRQSSRGE